LLGSIEIVFLPSLNSILFSILIIFIGASLFFIPTFDISSIKIFADPSRIGTS